MQRGFVYDKKLGDWVAPDSNNLIKSQYKCYELERRDDAICTLAAKSTYDV